MAASTAQTVAATPASTAPSRVAAPAHNLALGYLRGFLVVLVLAHHSVIAYIAAPLGLPQSLDAQPRFWRAFPVMDPHAQWTGFGVFTGFNDDFFMSLMFFISGLFVWSSLRRKGTGTFVRERMIRLGIPFIAAAAIVAPLAYYPTYLQIGGRGVSGYVSQWMAFGDWPTGPAWFIWLLLAFDLVAAALFAARPDFGDAVGSFTANARMHPVRFYLALGAVAAVASMPLLLVYSPVYWTSVGPFQFQTTRLFHYFVYFMAGIGVGSYGIDRGLLAPDGTLARHPGRWAAFGLAIFFASIVYFLFVITHPAFMSSVGSGELGGVFYSFTCAALSLGFLALFIRFANRRRWIWDSLSDNEYGMYLIHYMFVSWLQLALLPAMIPAIGKGALVFAGTLLLSWGTSAAIRSIPGVRRVV